MTTPGTPYPSLEIRAEDGLVTLIPSGWPEAESLVAEQTLAVRGGTMAVRPDAPAGTFPRALVVDPDEALPWLPAAFGPDAAAAVRAAFASASDSTVTVAARPERPALVESLRALGRAEWYLRWWPSCNPTDDRQPSLDAGVLDVDLGTLGWECAPVLEPDARAAERLGRSTGVLLALVGRARTSTGRLREYLDDRLARAVDATLDLASGAADDLAALAAVREREGAADAAVQRALAAWPGAAPRARSLAPGLVAAGGDAAADRGAASVRFSTVDWALVPPRSVSGLDLNVALVAAEDPGGLRVDLRVEAGDDPVPALDAYVHTGARHTLVARVALPLDAGRYVGRVWLPTLALGDVDRLSVHVVAPTVRRSPYFPDAPLPWLSPARRGREDADRAFVRRVLGDQLAAAGALETRPLLCELVLE